MKYRVFVSGVLLLLLLSGCSGGLRTSISKPFLTDLQYWPQEYQRNRKLIHSFSGNARFTIESLQYSGHVSVKTYFVKPDTLFLQAEGPLGVDVGKIFIGKSRFIFYNQFENSFVSANLDNPFLGRFFQTNIPLKDLKRAIIGEPPTPVNSLKLADSNRGIFTYMIGQEEYRYIVNPQNGLLEAWEQSSGGQIEVRQEFLNYRQINDIYIPAQIKITLPQKKERITVFYKDIKLNKPVDPDVYTISINPKVKQLNLN
jgi:outer membrane lipoprotein-sorting protein